MVDSQINNKKENAVNYSFNSVADNLMYSWVCGFFGMPALEHCLE